MFCKLASEKALKDQIGIDNLFIVEYMPYAPDCFVKVYLYGLSLAVGTCGSDNQLDIMARHLRMESDEILAAYTYWQEQGLCRVIYSTPIYVEYCMVRPYSARVGKFVESKYKSFNAQLAAIFPNRDPLPIELNEYYTAMEELHIEPMAMIAIITYCKTIKGDKLVESKNGKHTGWRYIVAVARSFAEEGYRTVDQVAEKLSELDVSHSELKAVLKALNSKSAPDHECKSMYVKWTKQMGFGTDAILHAARRIKRGGVQGLNAKLTKYFEAQILSTTEMDAYEARKDMLYSIARDTTKALGLSYGSLDSTIDTYIVRWLDLGFSEDAILEISKICFRMNARTLDRMDEEIDRFYRKGLLTTNAIASHLNQVIESDGQISKVLQSAGIDRRVTSRDRDSYRTWTYTWNLSQDLILYAATLSLGKVNPMSYINAILGNWQKLGITTVTEAKKANQAIPAAAAAHPTPITEYTVHHLDALFDDLEEM